MLAEPVLVCTTTVGALPEAVGAPASLSGEIVESVGPSSEIVGGTLCVGAVLCREAPKLMGAPPGGDAPPSGDVTELTDPAAPPSATETTIEPEAAVVKNGKNMKTAAATAAVRPTFFS
ncbi:MAG TPA: hypothetical protein VMB05_12430 [Solirubrobacteraceae bacterium]|nr:hypothetical protein [Solirubrobacteraceae bacterium]